MANNLADISEHDEKSEQIKKNNNGMFFVDGVRRIDFVLVYQSKTKNENEKKEKQRLTFLETLEKDGLEIEVQDEKGSLHPIDDSDGLKHGLHVDGSPCHRSNLVFVKISASWDTLCRYAEIMKIRKPLPKIGNEDDITVKTFFQRIFERFDFLKVFNINESLLDSIPRGLTRPFDIKKSYLFEKIKDEANFFTPAERSLMVNYIMRRASYRHISNKTDKSEQGTPHKNDPKLKTMPDDEESNIELCVLKKHSWEQDNFEELKGSSGNMDFGIAKLISDGVFESAFILHEKPLTEKDAQRDTKDNVRNLLYKHWVLMRNIFRLQPLDHIRLYFGEKVAFYFAWLGYYTYWLFPISVLGVIITIYNLMYTANDDVVLEVKNSTVNMCPLICLKNLCKFWELNEAHRRFFIIRILDNGATVILAVVMSIWASLFLEMWKRQQANLAYRWNVHDMEYEEEPPRPEFIALIEKSYPSKINKLSGKEEPYIPFWRRRIPVIFFTYSTVLLSIILALSFLAGIILYKLIIQPLLMQSRDDIDVNKATIITAATGSIISLIIIMILTRIYSNVAEWLTDLEHHRTQSQYDSSITLKLYLLEFVNNYSSIFYMGFLQQYTQPVPTYIASERIYLKPKGCPPGGCLLDLSMQLTFIMIGKQIISHIKEYTLPRVAAFCKKRKLIQSEKKIIYRKDIDDEDEDETDKVVIVDPSSNVETKSIISQELTRCYHDNLLADPGPRPLFGEYLEMLIQFGFITIFIPAFPLAPLLALFNNLLEIRSDALKFVRALRRPVAQRAKDIGIWISILSIVAQIAVKSNAILIAFSTTYIERLIYKISFSNGTLSGFIDFSMSRMESKQFPTYKPNETDPYCRYMGYRNDNLGYTSVYWQILAFKVIFVYVFENLVSLFMTIISVLIPDVPDKLRISMKREVAVTNDIILTVEVNRNKNDPEKIVNTFKNEKWQSKRRPSRPTSVPPSFPSLALRVLKKKPR